MYNTKSFKSLSNASRASTISRGFTIIELLIVIVIIGILVAITAVSYNGITKSASESVVKSDLKQAMTALELNKAKTGVYPASLSTNVPVISQPSKTTLTYIQLNNGQSYSLSASANSNQNVAFQTGPNDEVGQTTPFSNGSVIQTANKSNCPISRTMAVDARDKKTYWIQKLADGNCWMLTNLAYAGGGTNTYGDVINQGTGAPGNPRGTLSNGTNDSTSTYTLAKYYIPLGANPTTEPTAPSTSTNGTGQYGYLYNWCAAMGGQNTAACANATTPAPIPTTNIYPDGWRLPTGGSGGEFTALNNAINGGSTSSDVGLLSNGLFQRSGIWGGAFSEQTGRGLYWSSTTSVASDSYRFNFYSTYVGPAGSGKYYSFAIRCIAQ